MALRRCAWALLFAFAVLPAQAGDLRLELPIACDPGRDCYIQNYFDHDPGPGWRDYACGRLSYDGHTGTDFRLSNRRQMEDGVDVVAAAPGTVIGARDGEPDVALGERSSPLRKDREAGNGVRIDHGGGWDTQYSHLHRDSLRVRVGDHVEAGTVLGRVGLSGRTEFPHVDFTVRKDGRTLDPFAPATTQRCGDTTAALWSAQVLAKLAYQASGVLGSGFAARPLSEQEIVAGDRFVASLGEAADAIVFHVEVFGVRAGDVEEISLSDAQGRVLARRQETLERDLAVRRPYLGKRRGQAVWSAGLYAGRYLLRRGDAVVAQVERRVRVAQ